jgi:hypothetical protein
MRTKHAMLLIILFVVPVLVLSGCRRGQEEEENNLVSEDVQLEERVNRFLDESGVSLPENGERANMSDETGGDATGVVNRQTEGNQTMFTVLAALPEPTGNYHAWVDTGEESYLYLGRLTPAKGGYLLEKTIEGEFSGNEVVVSDEVRVGETPTNIVLRGQFGQSS